MMPGQHRPPRRQPSLNLGERIPAELLPFSFSSAMPPCSPLGGMVFSTNPYQTCVRSQQVLRRHAPGDVERRVLARWSSAVSRPVTGSPRKSRISFRRVVYGSRVPILYSCGFCCNPGNKSSSSSVWMMMVGLIRTSSVRSSLTVVRLVNSRFK